MTAAVSDVLLAVGVVVIAVSCAALAVLRDALDRVHVLAPVGTLGVAAVAAAVVVRDGVDGNGLTAIGIAAVSIGTGPFTSHAIARSIAVRRRHDPDRSDGGPLRAR